MHDPAAREDLWVCHLGTVEYRTAVALQEHVRDLRQRDRLPDTLLLLDHPPVYTRGRRTQEGELPMGEDWYRAQGIDVVDTARGGKVTYHAAGQLVGYPIMRITDVPVYVHVMEEAIIAALGAEEVGAAVREGLTGVWVEDRKIASIGIHVSRGVTAHGFAINVENDLQPFSWAVPCGLAGVSMTSVSRERGERVGLSCFRRRAGHAFCEAFGRRQRLVSPARLGVPGLPPAPARIPQAAPA